MFVSFFPTPRYFFPSAVVFAGVAIALWLLTGEAIGAHLGGAAPQPKEGIIGLGYFVTPQFLAFYVYYALCTAVFFMAWRAAALHPWMAWSILGSALIIFTTYMSVQVTIAINNWRRPFFDTVQKALSGGDPNTVSELYRLILIFAEIGFMWVAIYTLTRFFVSHYIFRWRTAMNDFYMARWHEVRHVEGAAQRIQEDTMRFATIMEDLGVSIIDAVMTLFAFLPVLFALSAYVTELPIVGAIPAPLLYASIAWSLFGTLLLAVAGIKLPGLNFANQRVEAAYRKELVYGEDDPGRAQPETVTGLFTQVRANYFRLYFHYAYFNIFRSMYIQADNVFAYLILIPTIAAGKITFGVLQQILTAFGQVSNSFQYLVNSWTTIVELLSIRKRLLAFEAHITSGPDGTEAPSRAESATV